MPKTSGTLFIRLQTSNRSLRLRVARGALWRRNRLGCTGIFRPACQAVANAP